MRLTSASRVRSMNWAIWIPVAVSRRGRSPSVTVWSRPKNSRTPTIPFRPLIGTATPTVSPSRAATAARKKLSSSPRSVINTSRPSAHALPGKLPPGGNGLRRLITSNSSRSVPGPRHMAAHRRTSGSASRSHNAPMAHPSCSHTAWSTAGTLSSIPSPADSRRASSDWRNCS
jgi:hypothetical protein